MFVRRRVRPVFRSGILLLVLLFVGRELSYSVSTVSDYVIHVWQAENGLPQNSVTSVIQTRDGYIWIGTYGALARFDGVRFTVFDTGNTPGMHSSRVTSLFEAGDGTLWIGHEDGAVTRYQAGWFEPVDFQSSWSDKGIFHIGEDAAGDIWLASRDCQFTRLRDGRTCKPPGVRVWVSASTSPDGVWVAGNGIVSSIQHGDLAPMQLGQQPLLNQIRGICPGREGGFWVVNDGLLRKWDGQKCVKDLGAAPWALSLLTTMIETRAGLVVAGTYDQGLYLISKQGEVLHFSRTNGLPSDWITSAIEDREGNLWVGTRAGLVMLHATGITTVAPPDKFRGYPVFSVAIGPEGEIWAATEGAGIYRLKNGQWSHYGRESGLYNTYVWSVSPDAGGRAWAGTWGEGVFVQQGDSFGRAPGLYFRLPILALFHEAGDVTWVGTSAGLVRYHAGETEWIVREQQMTSPNVRCLVRDGEGVLWFGMFGGGLGCLNQGKLRQFRKSDGLPSDFVQCLRADADGSLWIGTFGGGLARMKHGRFAAIGRDQGLPGNDVGDIEEDGQGFFWISSNKRILRVSKAELNRCADGLSREIHCRPFAVNDGVPTLECSGGLQPAGCKTSDGHLWFPTSAGLVTIDPERIQTNQLPPPVMIEKLLVDDQVAAENPADATQLRMPPGRHRVELQYTALSYIAPERVKFKYRLKGLDRDWIQAGTSRTADYNYIPHGKYVFQVVACNNDAVWNEAGAQIAFTVPPFFWQTPWFRILAVATVLVAVGGIAWLDARRRLQRKLEHIERQRAVEQERVRIAHDIHDDLGAHLTRITMLSDPVRGGSGNGPQAAASLRYIHETAGELTQAMAETVWAVNPHHDTLDSLVNYLQKFAQDFLEHADIRCRLDVPFQLPAWALSAETRHSLFLAFKETLNNIVKHAGASEVHICLTLEPAGFLLVVKDNGRGFADETAAGANDPAQFIRGNGLRNIRRRMAGIGGRCEIRSAPRQGTKVQFRVPVQTPPAGNGGAQ